MEKPDRAERRKWADIVVIVVAIWSFGQALWGPTLFAERSQDQGASTMWVMSAVAGLLGLLGLFATTKRPGIGRAMIAVAGVLLLLGPFAYRVTTPLPMAFGIVSGLLLLAAAKFAGPLYKPAQ